MSQWSALHALRIGCVRYLNSQPLIHGYDGEVRLDHPSALARELAAGQLDVTPPQGKRAFAITINQLTGVGNLVQAGDTVDVLISLSGGAFPVVQVLDDGTITVVTGLNPLSVKLPLLLEEIPVLGTIEVTVEDPTGVTLYFEEAVENRPNDRSAHFHLGRLRANQAEYDEAIQHFLKTLTPEDESTPRYLYALAATYARAGNSAEALRYARTARDQAAARGQAEMLASIERDFPALAKR